MKQDIEQESIIQGSTQTESYHPGIFSLAGPISILLTILLLVVKESPYYIDLAAVGLVGLILSWRFSLPGFLFSNFILLGVLFYDVFVEGQLFGLWDVGVVTTLEFAFILTILSGKELLEEIQSFGQDQAENIRTAQRQLNEVLSDKQSLEKRLKETQVILSQKTEAAEQFERLLKMARDEVLHEIKKREGIETLFFEQKREIAKLQEKLEETHYQLDQVQLLKQIIDQKEHELFSLKTSMPLAVNPDQGKIQELESTIEQLSFEKGGIESSYNLLEKNFEELDKKYHEQAALFHENEQKIQDLADRLEKLTDRLKEVQKEKDELEKQLDQAIQPEPAQEIDPSNPLKREYRRIEGLYFQLREQFEEKKHLLDQTRSELFHLQELTLSQTRESIEREEESFVKLSDEYRKLLRQYVLTNQDFDEQINKYEDLIASLSQ